MYRRGEGAVKPGRHVFDLKVGTEGRIMDFINRYMGGKK